MRKVLLISEDGPWDREELKRWRNRLGLTQMEAAVALGFSLRAIESWEGGQRSPSAPAAVRKLMKTVKPRRRA